MKKTILFLLLFFCLLLSACAAGTETAQPAQSPAAESSAAPEPAPEAAPEPVQADPSPSPEQQPPEPKAPEEKIEGIFPLLDQDGVRLELVIYRNAETMATELALWMYLEEPDADVTCTVTEPVLNGSVLLREDYRSWGDDAVQRFQLDVGSLFARGILSPEHLESFSCHVQRFAWNQNYTEKIIYLDTDCEVTIPEGFRPDYVFLDCLGARAGEQVLCDDENMRVTLLGLGNPPWEDAGRMGFLLQAENLSDTSLPFKISGLSANGAFCSFYGDSTVMLPGTVSYMYSELYYNSFTEAEITQIQDLALLLLTNDSENTGAFTVSGGSWYPVELIGSSGEGEAPEILEPIFENDWIRVGLVEMDEHAPFREDGEYSYSWRLVVENISDTDLELNRYREENESLPEFFFSEGKIRAGGWRYMTLTTYVPNGTPRPALYVRFVAHTLGGGKLLFLENTPIRLPTEP